jgi:hypothetical protein
MPRPPSALHLAFVLACASCSTDESVPRDESERSPNAGIQPAPLSVEDRAPGDPDGLTPVLRAQALSPALQPLSLREDTALEPEVRPIREPLLVELRGRFSWVPAPEREQVHPSFARLAKHTALAVHVTLGATGRMRLRLDSAGFVLPDQSELHARSDLRGHVLLWPKGRQYRHLPKGSLRSLLTERRADIAPLVVPDRKVTGTAKVLGHSVEQEELSTPHGRASLALAEAPGLELAATLLCRLLSELVAAEPDNAACRSGRLPLRAEYFWPGGTGLTFSVEHWAEAREPSQASWAIPPPEAAFTRDAWPEQPRLFANPTALAELRGSRDEAPNLASLLVDNNTDLLRYVLLSGVSVAWVPPHSTVTLQVPPGRYDLTLRDFLGLETPVLRSTTAPAKVTLAPPSDEVQE